MHERNTRKAASAPDEEDFRLEICVARTVVHQIWRRVRDSPIQKPVRGGGNREGFGPDLQGEDLTSDDPGGGVSRDSMHMS